MFDLNFHIHRLLSSEPFFAALSRRITKVRTTDLPTAGVAIDEESLQFIMYYNAEWMGGLRDEAVRDVIIHELYHLVFEHVGTRLPSEGMTKRWNVACDLAINCYLDDLPENALRVGQEGTPWEHLPAYKGAEWYMANIDWPDSDSASADILVGGNRGVHDRWGEGSDNIISERLKEVMTEAVQEADSKGWGSVSREIRSNIVASLRRTVDWRCVLRSFLSQSTRTNKRSTMRRLNRRYPYIHPGKRVTRTAKLAISIDNSGSVSDSLLEQFFGELNSLATLVEFTVIPFDTEVSETQIYKWEKGNKRPATRVLRGGTDFNAPTKWVNGQKFDGHIILTDMEAPKPIASRCPRLWVTTKEAASKPYFKTRERIIGI